MHLSLVQPSVLTLVLAIALAWGCGGDASVGVETVARLHADIPDFDATSPLGRVDAVRDWVYEQTDVAATRDRLIDYGTYRLWRMDPDDIFALYAGDVGGVWCDGAANGLRRVYEAVGYRAWVLSYGIKGKVTHAVTLVEVEGDVYLQDAYFNSTYVDASGRHLPFYDVLRRIKQGEPVHTAPGARILRDVHLSRPSALEHSWTTAGQEGLDCRPSGEREGALTCRARTFAANFVAHYELEPTYAHLEQAGYRRDLDDLLLFPYGVSNGDGYVSEPAKSEILRRILAISGHLGG